MIRPQTIQVFLPAGDPTGIRVATLTTRTVRLFEVPRPLLSQFLSMPESAQVGVYYLFGADSDGTEHCYVGQTGEIRTRLKQHAADASKDFFTHALVAVSLTNDWVGTHVAYLEWLSIAQAKLAGRYELVNGTTGGNPHTPPWLKADCDEFFETISVLLSTLGRPVLEVPDRRAEGAAPASRRLFFRERSCNGQAVQTPEGVLVLEGSIGRADTVPSASDTILRDRERLIRESVIVVDGETIRFTRDHLFRSPSGAASVLAGGNQDGRKGWRSTAGKSLKDIEAEQLATPEGGA